MRISERGSAVAEFLLLILPLFGLSAGAIGVSWFAFAKTQLLEVAQELAVFQSQPDTDLSELSGFADQVMSKRFKGYEYTLLSGDSTVVVTIPPKEFAGPFALLFPSVSAESHVSK